jgi:hypothetical protein
LVKPHRALHTNRQIDLRALRVHYHDHDFSDNPPLLHQKDLLVAPDYPRHEKFAKLRRQEDDWGLLEALRKDSGGDSLRASTHRRGWLKCLEAQCLELKEHQVVWQKPIRNDQFESMLPNQLGCGGSSSGASWFCLEGNGLPASPGGGGGGSVGN